MVPNRYHIWGRVHLVPITLWFTSLTVEHPEIHKGLRPNLWSNIMLTWSRGYHLDKQVGQLVILRLYRLPWSMRHYKLTYAWFAQCMSPNRYAYIGTLAHHYPMALWFLPLTVEHPESRQGFEPNLSIKHYADISRRNLPSGPTCKLVSW
jgi:hypothetical protein